MTSPTELRLSEALHDIVESQPFAPDPAAIERRGRRLRRRTTAARSAAGLGVTAAVTAAALAATGTFSPGTAAGHQAALPRPAAPHAASPHGASPHGASPHGASPKAGAPHGASSRGQGTLMGLAAYIMDSPRPAGNATLVIRDQLGADGQVTGGGADLYTDSGQYYYAPTESGLPAVIAAHETTGGGMFGREVAAAVYATTGDLAIARQRMADAPFSSGSPPSEAATIRQLRAVDRIRHIKFVMPKPLTPAQRAASTDNYVWEDSLDALSAGAGNPLVRAGVLRILSTVPDVTVTNTTAAGQPALTLTAGPPALPANYQEALTINAHTGVPIAFAGGTVGQQPSATVSYQVSRVILANIAAGRF